MDEKSSASTDSATTMDDTTLTAGKASLFSFKLYKSPMGFQKHVTKCFGAATVVPLELNPRRYVPTPWSLLDPSRYTFMRTL